MRRCILLALGACLLAAPARPADDGADDERVLAEAKVGTDGPALLAFFRHRTVDGTDEARIKALVKKLGDDDFETREGASAALVAVGARAKPHLRTATGSKDPEVRRRAADCLRAIERGATAVVVAAAARVTARRKPAGAAGVLLAYLPSAEDGRVADEVRQALVALAVRGGKAEPALVAALGDKLAVKRGAAAAALCLAKAPGQAAAVRKLLRDTDAAVRLRVALALVTVRDKDAIKEALPVLIASLDRPPLPETGLVEDLLYRLAGEKAPTETPGKDEESRRRYRTAWQAWYKAHGARLTTAQLEEVTRTLGYTLVVLLDRGIVMELDAANKPRWEIGELEFPLDAQVLPGDRLLVAENKGNRVTERNRKGEVLWEKKITGPLTAQRLRNGHTFITTQTQLVEVDKTGAVVSSYTRPAGELFMRATKLPNGDIACITQLGVTRYVRLDKNGKEIKSFGVEVHTSGGRLDVRPNGHVLIPELYNNRVVEYDATGKVVWEVTVPQPIVAVRLPNGHTLITSMTQRRAVELDRAGKEVWQYKRTDSRVTRAYRR